MEKRKGNTEETHLLTVQASDGTGVLAEVEGEGRVILILHPGMATSKNYAKVAARLARRYRVIRLHRRQYRLDLKTDPLRGSPCTIVEEVEHVLTIVKAVGEPVLLFGHSSGGTVALEALVASPSSFVGGMIYEPASMIETAAGLRLGEERIERAGETSEGLKRARQALMEGRPNRAFGTFMHVVGGLPSILANLVGTLSALFPDYYRLIPCQIDDMEALERLGLRLDAYAKLNLPVAMVGGERSPESLKRIVVAVADVVPSGERIRIGWVGWASHASDPQQLADVMETFAKRVFEEVP